MFSSSARTVDFALEQIQKLTTSQQPQHNRLNFGPKCCHLFPGPCSLSSLQVTLVTRNQIIVTPPLKKNKCQHSYNGLWSPACCGSYGALTPHPPDHPPPLRPPWPCRSCWPSHALGAWHGQPWQDLCLDHSFSRSPCGSLSLPRASSNPSSVRVPDPLPTSTHARSLFPFPTLYFSTVPITV